VLSGSWPGRQRAASPVLAVVRGATSRIRDYRRVQVRGRADVAVVSRAVEPAVLAIAELLDNAARHSQPDTPVEVSVQAAHNGVSVVIDDCGVGMLEEEMRQAAALLSGEQPVDVTRLGDPPAFGHAVVGRLAARYGFRAFADSSSPFGGLRAVVFLPSALLTPIEPAAPAPAPRETTAPEAAAPEAAIPAPPAPSADDLPQRRRRRPAAEHARADASPDPQAPERRSARDDAAVLGAFQRGTRAGRATAPADTRADNPAGARADNPAGARADNPADTQADAPAGASAKKQNTPESPTAGERQPQR
jgi:pyruvate/2-oxoglutarate dehydrogenase complex dihydrolipoamide acyltransferase (E2) component